MSDTLSTEELPRLIRENWLMVDVRSSVEAQDSAIPKAVNIPILDDAQRVLVGTCYKQQGREKAIELGHQLVSGEVKQKRVAEWTRALTSHEKSLLFCFRGGLRSQIAQKWCAEAGVVRPRLKEGAKALRQSFLAAIQEFSSRGSLVVLSGATGSGKTVLLRQVDSALQTLDLEKWANHRGSAFGKALTPQPEQATFENLLAWRMLAQENYHTSTFLVEDESRLIGKIVQPEVFFGKLRASPVVLIDEPVANRAEQIFEEYVEEPLRTIELSNLLARLRDSLASIHRRLGGARAQEVFADLKLMEEAYGNPDRFRERGLAWIEKLILWYYDPMYFSSLARRKPEILFKGSRQDVSQFLLDFERLKK